MIERRALVTRQQELTTQLRHERAALAGLEALPLPGFSHQSRERRIAIGELRQRILDLSRQLELCRAALR